MHSFLSEVKLQEANAKINLSLKIVSKRPDNYHELSTIMLACDLHDVLRFVWGDAACPYDAPAYVSQVEAELGDISVRLYWGADKPEHEAFDKAAQHDSAAVSAEAEKLRALALERNILYKSLKIFTENLGPASYAEFLTAVRATAGAGRPYCHILLHKNIPSEAGLGGGSADAAALWRYLHEAFPSFPEWQQLPQWLAATGADVPFLYHKGFALCLGIGEIISPLDFTADFDLLIIKPDDISVSTGAAFAEFDLAWEQGKLNYLKPQAAEFLEALRSGSYELLPAYGGNTFAELVLKDYEQLPQLTQFLYDEGAFYAGLSGSGSAVFGLFPPEALSSFSISDLAVKLASVFGREFFVYKGKTLS